VFQFLNRCIDVLFRRLDRRFIEQSSPSPGGDDLESVGMFKVFQDGAQNFNLRASQQGIAIGGGLEQEDESPGVRSTDS
jgi:hypothetical protein